MFPRADEKVRAQTIAPKFTGRFNEGVDYVGDLAQFEREFNDDLAVIAHAVKAYGLPANLKLSVHSGSDKFSLYPIIKRALQRTGAGFGALALQSLLSRSGLLAADSSKAARNPLAPRAPHFAPTGNRAFDDYREDTLNKLEQEADEFRSFLDRFVGETRGELFETAEACIAYYSQPDNFRRLEQGEIGDNLMYRYRAIASFHLWDAICDAAMDATRELLEERGVSRFEELFHG